MGNPMIGSPDARNSAGACGLTLPPSGPSPTCAEGAAFRLWASSASAAHSASRRKSGEREQVPREHQRRHARRLVHSRSTRHTYNSRHPSCTGASGEHQEAAQGGSDWSVGAVLRLLVLIAVVGGIGFVAGTMFR